MSVEPPKERLRSLDVFRGATVAFMILVNSPGNHTSYAQLEHASWSGCTLTDWVFPFFLFIVGVSIAFAFPKRLERGETRGALLAHAAKRAAVLFALGLFFNGFPFTPERLASLRILGVLQRIGLCYFLAAALFLYLSRAGLAAVCAGILLGYWALMRFVPVPGFGAGDLSIPGNLASWIDHLIIGSRHMYRHDQDPEGILTTFPATATTLIGVLAGMRLKAAQGKGRLIAAMAVSGAVLCGLGLLWSFWFPFNKALWTSSYVLYTGGLAVMLLMGCHWLVDMKKFQSWIAPFEAFGINALAAYFLSILFIKILVYTKLPMPDGTPGDLHLYITHVLFESWLSPKNASLAFALAFTGVWLAALWPLYRRRILIKL